MKHLLKKTKLSETPTTQVVEQVETSVAAESGTFEKIPVTTPKIKPKKRPRKLFIVTSVIVLLLVLAVTLFGILPARAAYAKAQNLSKVAKEFAAVLKSQNLEEAKAQLPGVKSALEETQKAWDQVLLLKVLPVANNYHADGRHGLAAGSYGLEAVQIAIETIEPYSDLLGLKAGSSFTAGSADERIQLAVKTLDKVTPKVGEIGQKVEGLKKEIDQIDPARYPEHFKGQKVRSQLVEAKQLVDDSTKLFLSARPLLEVLPSLLGEPEAKRYLFLFQNDKELRPTGGFLTAYAIFRLESGKIIVEHSEDIYKLDEKIAKKEQATPEILTYHKGVYYKNIRDSNLSPDFSVSMKAFEELYPGDFDFDGIIGVDTHVLVEAIKILGEFYIGDRKFSAENDERCNCPRVIYELEDYATRPVAYVREARKDILGTLLLDIMKKALGVSPSQYWGSLFQMGIDEINQKHILAYMKDEKAQLGVESLNMAGRIADGTEILGYRDGQDKDYLHISDANMASAKSNLFVTHAVKQEYEVRSDGTITKTLTLDYKNPASPSDCNLERGGLCLNAYLYRNWVRIYVPKGSTLVEGKGAVSPKDEETPIDFIVKEDLGKTVFEGFFTLRAQGSSQLVVKYTLPFKVEKTLTALVQKQPGTQGHDYSTWVNGKQKEQFSLIADRVSELQLK